MAGHQVLVPPQLVAVTAEFRILVSEVHLYLGRVRAAEEASIRPLLVLQVLLARHIPSPAQQLIMQVAVAVAVGPQQPQVAQVAQVAAAQAAVQRVTTAPTELLVSAVAAEVVPPVFQPLALAVAEL